MCSWNLEVENEASNEGRQPRLYRVSHTPNYAHGLKTLEMRIIHLARHDHATDPYVMTKCLTRCLQHRATPSTSESSVVTSYHTNDAKISVILNTAHATGIPCNKSRRDILCPVVCGETNVWQTNQTGYIQKRENPKEIKAIMDCIYLCVILHKQSNISL